MDTFADRARLDAIKVILKGYAPSVPLAFMTRNLGFDNDVQCAYFLEDHGCVLGSEKSAVDCKASRPLLVDYSIAVKQEEERKAAQRKEERIAIEF